MAFSGLTFPNLKLKHGITKEMVDPISITGNGAREVRRKQNKTDRGVWTFPARVISEDDKQTLVKFLKQTNMGLDSFYFQDPTYPNFVDAVMTHRSSNTYWLNIPFDSTTAGTHPVLRPKMSELTVKLNGVTTTATVQTDSTTGKPFIQTAGAGGSSITCTVSGPCYLVARFAGTVAYRIVAMARNGSTGCDVAPTHVELQDFQIVEVFE